MRPGSAFWPAGGVERDGDELRATRTLRADQTSAVVLKSMDRVRSALRY
jgi:hypothetical protein